MLKIINSFLMLFLLFIISCTNKNSVEPVTQEEGKVQFGFSSSSLAKSIKKTTSGGITNIVVDIETAGGQVIFSNKIIHLINMNGDYITEPISMKSGNYRLTKFLVTDATDSVLYATPMAGSAAAYLVNNALPISFTITQDAVNKLVPEVISTTGLTAQSFGYSTFSFEIIPTFNFQVSVFKYNNSTSSYDLITGNLSIVNNVGTTIFTGVLIAGTNNIILKDGYSSYQLTITKNGFINYAHIFTSTELKSYSNTPLQIILESAVTNNFFGFGTDGDFNSTGNTTLTSILNGDVVVRQYANFTLNAGHTFTVSNRCKGLVIYVNGDAVINGTISMTGKGATGQVSEEVTFIRETVNGTDERSASSVVPCGTALVNIESNQPPITHGKIITLGACAGGTGIVGSQSQGWFGIANPGVSTGNNTWKTGGGGAGGSLNGATGGAGAIGTPFVGGSGGGAMDKYSGTGNSAGLYGAAGGSGYDDWEDRAGGGAGYPAATSRSGTRVAGLGGGGLVILIVKGSVTIGSTGRIESNGGNGGSAQTGSYDYATGGGAGGGIVGIIYGGTLVNNGTTVALGGNANDGNSGAHRTCYGGNGGNGSVNFLQVLH